MIKFCHEEGIKDCLEIGFKLFLNFQRKISPPILKVFLTVYKAFLPTLLVLNGLAGSYN